jgi:hypothetical protein
MMLAHKAQERGLQSRIRKVKVIALVWWIGDQDINRTGTSSSAVMEYVYNQLHGAEPFLKILQLLS